MAEYSQFLPKNFQSKPQNDNYCSIDLNTNYSAKQSTTSKPLILIIILLILVVGICSSYLFYLRPRIVSIAIINRLIPKINNNLQSVNNVGSSLDKMVHSILQETPNLNIPNKAYNINTNEKIAGITTEYNLQSWHQLMFDRLKLLEEDITTNSALKEDNVNVLGIEDFENPYIQQLRKIKQYADEGKYTVLVAKNDIIDIKDYLNLEKDIVNDQLTKSQINKLININNRTKLYYNEVEKIFFYQSEETDITIQTLPLLLSYFLLIDQLALSEHPEIYITKLDELQKTNNTLKKRIELLGQNKIPQGYNNIHQDNIKFFQYVDLSMTKIKSSVNNGNQQDYILTVQEFGSNIEPLITKGTTATISYWKDNRYIKEYNTYYKEYNSVKNNLFQIKNENNLPMIEKLSSI